MTAIAISKEVLYIMRHGMTTRVLESETSDEAAAFAFSVAKSKSTSSNSAYAIID